MASSSRQRSSSLGRSPRKKVVISGDRTTGGSDRKPRRDSTKSATGAKSSAAARRASDKRREDRERRLSQQRLMVWLRVVGASILAVAMVVGLVALYRSSIFSVEQVEVIGNKTVTTARVLEVAAVPSDATLLRFPAARVKERLESDPWIDEATVTRDFPDTMRIRVVERAPFAYLDQGGESFWVVDSTGFFIAEKTPDASSTLVVLRDIEDVAPELGTKTDSDVLQNALAVYGGLSPDSREMVRTISAPSIDKTTLITHSDIEILVGSAEDIQRKDRVARQILREQEGAVIYVNVRTVDRPTWRGIGE